MTLARGFKMVDTALRGAKMVASVAKRRGKFLPSIKNLNDITHINHFANNVATGMQTAGQYAALGSHLAPGQYGTMLRDAGNSLTKGGESIQNVRNNALARRAKQDFGNKSIMD